MSKRCQVPMPRPQLIRSKTHSYYVSSKFMSEINPPPLEEVWNILMEELENTKTQFGLEAQAVVLMNSQFHFLCKSPISDLDKCMQFFLKKIVQRINKSMRRSGHLLEGRYKWSLIKSQQQFFQVYRYLYQGPVREGKCQRVEEYPYSSLMFDYQKELNWLNENLSNEGVEMIRSGLRRAEFDVSLRLKKKFERLSIPEVYSFKI